jgi:hypothetical protein
VQIHEFSGEELEDVASKFLIPVIARARPDYRGRVAIQELDEALTPRRFAEDAETLVAGEWDPDDNLPAVSLAKLEDQTHLTADATQHIATWASGMVTPSTAGRAARPPATSERTRPDLEPGR